MSDPDLNLLTALDILLTEGSVAGAARRLRLSASAMSRTLARLREATGDQLLVRAGRGLVPTPHAALLRERARSAAEEARAVLQPAGSALNLARLERSFTVRANEGLPWRPSRRVSWRRWRRRHPARACGSRRSRTRVCGRCARGWWIWMWACWGRRVRRCGCRPCSRTASSARCGTVIRCLPGRSRQSATHRSATSSPPAADGRRGRSMRRWPRWGCRGPWRWSCRAFPRLWRSPPLRIWSRWRRNRIWRGSRHATPGHRRASRCRCGRRGSPCRRCGTPRLDADPAHRWLRGVVLELCQGREARRFPQPAPSQWEGVLSAE